MIFVVPMIVVGWSKSLCSFCSCI